MPLQHKWPARGGHGGAALDADLAGLPLSPDQAEARCPGCGAALQTLDAAAPGFIVAAHAGAPGAVCRRCYRMDHYGELAVAPIEAPVKPLAHSDRARVVLVADVTDLEDTLPAPDVLEALLPARSRGRRQRPTLVVTKMDALPKGAAPARVERWVRARVRAKGLDVGDVRLVSARSGAGMAGLAAALRQTPKTTKGKGKGEILLLGAANAGKSSLVSRLLKRDSSLRPTVSALPGTTVAETEWTAADGQLLRDSPGLVLDAAKQALAEQLTDFLPNKRLRPQVVSLRAQRSLHLGPVARVDFEHADRDERLLLVYHGRLPLHLGPADSRATQVDGAPPLAPRLDVALEQFLPAVERPPAMSARRENEHRRRRHRVSVADIALGGFGWLAVTPVDTTGSPFQARPFRGGALRVWTADGVSAVLREPLMPFEAVGHRL